MCAPGRTQSTRKAAPGLVGLSDVLNRRTAVETADPLAIDIETDELIFFPLLYWPVTADQPPPSPSAIERINRYIETGGTILSTPATATSRRPARSAARRLRRSGCTG